MYLSAEMTRPIFRPPFAAPGTDAAQRRRLRRDLGEATQREAFTLTISLRVRLVDGQVTGADATVRWPHRRRGVVSAASLMPIAERLGHADAIGGWALRAACREAAGWPGDARVGVALSAAQLAAADLPERIDRALTESGLAADRLDIGVPERVAAVADEDTILLLEGLRDLGCGVVLEEFGAELASLATLRRLPVTALRLDRGLCRLLPDNRMDAAVVAATIEAARAADVAVIADGVDNEAQRDFLAAAGAYEMTGPLAGVLLTPPETLARLT